MVSTHRHTPLSPRLAFAAAALLCLPAATSLIAGEGSPAPAVASATGEPAFQITVPAGPTLQNVHDAVLAAAVHRQWTVKEDKADHVVIYLSHRKSEATVTFDLTPSSVTATCVGYATNGKGTRLKPEQPTRWLKYLQEDVTQNLYGAARK